MVQEKDLQSLKKLGDLAKVLKQRLAQDSFKLKGDLITYVEQTIQQAGFKVEFPVVLAPDKLISNSTVLKENYSDPLNFKICTVDLGLRDPSTGWIVDTAVTLIREESLKAKVLNYQTILRSLERQLELKVSMKGGFWSHELTELVEDSFKGSDLDLVSYCAAHTIEKYQLHANTIPMKKVYQEQSFWIGEGSVFTIEPHVLLSPQAPVKIKDYTIIRSLKTNKIDSKDFRLNNIRVNQKIEKIYALESTSLSFFEEDTYVIRDHKLVNLTNHKSV